MRPEMRRILTIAALAVALLAAQGPAFAQSPNIQLQVQPKLQIQPKLNQPKLNQLKVNKTPTIPRTIPLSVVTRNIQNQIANSRVLKLVPLPSGDIVATIKVQNQIKKIWVNGQTGAIQN